MLQRVGALGVLLQWAAGSKGLAGALVRPLVVLLLQRSLGVMLHWSRQRSVVPSLSWRLAT